MYNINYINTYIFIRTSSHSCNIENNNNSRINNEEIISVFPANSTLLYYELNKLTIHLSRHSIIILIKIQT